jgi:hypothetical protein
MGYDTTTSVNKLKVIVQKAFNAKHLKLSVKENCIWSLWERNGEKFIICTTIHRNGREIGYKHLSESEHPFYYTCPRSWFKGAPVKCEEWRQRCQG